MQLVPLTIAMEIMSVPPEAASVSPGSLSMAFSNPAAFSAAAGGLGTLNASGGFSPDTPDPAAFGPTARDLGTSSPSRSSASAQVLAAPVDSSGGVRTSLKRKMDEEGFKAHIGMYAPANGE